MSTNERQDDSTRPSEFGAPGGDERLVHPRAAGERDAEVVADPAVGEAAPAGQPTIEPEDD